MSAHPPVVSPTCPDPLARAPRKPEEEGAPRDRLYLAPPTLQGALVAVVTRDTRGLALDGAQRLSHFPASPLVTLSWYQDLDAGLVERDVNGPVWRPFGAPVVIAGSQSQPTVSWAPTTGRGGMACFTPDAVHALFGIELATIHDRFLPVDEVLGNEWAPLWQALRQANDDAAAMAALETHLGARWHAIQGQNTAFPALRRLGRHWVERLAWQAMEWRRTYGPRHVERRVKSYSGRSLREWQSLVRTEGLFFAARERYESGQPFDWAGLAQEEGFADQAHMNRAAKRITGFAPGEFTQRFVEDESFWMYRLWV